MLGFNPISSFPFSTITITVGPIPPDPGTDGKGGWTPEERKRYKKLEQKIAETEKQRFKLLNEQKKKRKGAIANLIDPQPKQKKQNKVQSNQEVISDTPSLDLAALDRSIAYLQGKQEQLLKAAALRDAQAQIQRELAMIEAARLAELDDEEALLLLL